MATKTDALRSLAPNAEWVVSGDTIRWDSTDIDQPTDAEIDAEIVRLTANEPWVALREERNRRLSATDWWGVSDHTMSDAETTYRQALRDLPANTSDPVNPVWPTNPS